jgi:hypothetical protein
MANLNTLGLSTELKDGAYGCGSKGVLPGLFLGTGVDDEGRR